MLKSSVLLNPEFVDQDARVPVRPDAVDERVALVRGQLESETGLLAVARHSFGKPRAKRGHSRWQVVRRHRVRAGMRGGKHNIDDGPTVLPPTGYSLAWLVR